MSEPLSPTQLKNRLLGAVILVLAAVIIIPIFLGEAKQDNQAQTIGSTNKQFQSKIQPLPSAQGVIKRSGNALASEGDFIKSANGGLVLKEIDEMRPPKTAKADNIKKLSGISKVAPEPKAKAKAILKKAEPVVTSLEKKSKAEPVKAKPIIKKSAKPKKPESVLSSGWVVQTGTFSKTENANAIVEMLKNNGLQPKTSLTSASFGKATRVWLGPYASKAEAQAVSNKLEKQTGNGGFVASYPFKS